MTSLARLEGRDTYFAGYVARKMLTKRSIDTLVAEREKLDLAELAVLAIAIDQSMSSDKGFRSHVLEILSSARDRIVRCNTGNRSIPTSVIGLASRTQEKHGADWLADVLALEVSDEDKMLVISALGAHRDPSASETLAAFAARHLQTSKRLTLEAATQLARRKDGRAVNILFSLFRDRYFSLRSHALRALVEHFGDRKDVIDAVRLAHSESDPAIKNFPLEILDGCGRGK